MSIDWITVAAQIANFLVLVWLLKRFLYRPVLDGIDAREAQITDRMQEATQAQAAAKATVAEYQDKLREVHSSQSELEARIRTAAEQQRDTLMADVRAQIAQDQAEARTQLDAQARDYTGGLQRAGGAALLALTRKALGDLADETLEARMVEHLLGQIDTLQTELKQAAGGASAAVAVTHDALPPSVQASVRAQIGAVFPDATVTFETDAAQPCGLVLRIGGAQLAWTLDTYISGLEAQMTARLAKGTGR